MPDNSSIRRSLESFGDVTEVYEVTMFTGYRNGNLVTVRILDQGPDCSSPEIRFACDVVQDDGKKAGGNNASTLDEAIAIVHWEELD